MTVQEIAQDLVALCQAGKLDESGEKYWADNVVSLEAMDGDMARIEGIEGVRGKGAWWNANHDIHRIDVEGPYVHGDQFVVRFKMEVTPKDGQRMTMDEVGVYTVRGGKIVEERFFRGT